MFRSLSTRGSQGYGYDRLVDDSTSSTTTTTTTDPLGGPKLSRSRTTAASPGRFFNLSRKTTPDRSDFQAKGRSPEPDFQAKYAAKEVKKASKIMPWFSLFEKSRRKKATAKPEFARYMQYLKEGGVWDSNSPKPVIF